MNFGTQFRPGDVKYVIYNNQITYGRITMVSGKLTTDKKQDQGHGIAVSYTVYIIPGDEEAEVIRGKHEVFSSVEEAMGYLRNTAEEIGGEET